MAKFNTLAGGYYGKLGATVGQRWKNLRTVRTYVVPFNPRTPAQQANRGKFGDCVFYAQLASQMNARVTAFDTTSKTLWNARMSTARALQDLGLSELDRLPLYPTTFSVPITISEATITQIIDATHIEVTLNNNDFTEERVLTLLLLLPGAEDWQNRLALCVGSNGENGGNIFTFRLPENLTLTDGLKGRFVSCDDISSNVDLIASSQIELPIIQPEEREFDTTITSLERTGLNYVATFAQPYQDGRNTISDFTCRCVVNGEWQEWSVTNATLVNNGGFFAVAFSSQSTENQNLPAFPIGSTFNFPLISSNSRQFIYKAENKTENASNTDLTRTYNTKVISVSRSDTTFTFTLQNALPATVAESGEVTIKAVCRGQFQTLTAPSTILSKTQFSITQDAPCGEEIFAFASGSSVALNYSFIAENVTYNADNTAEQGITNDDLTREINGECTTAQVYGGVYACFTIYNATNLQQGNKQIRVMSYTSGEKRQVATTTECRLNLSYLYIRVNDGFSDEPLFFNDGYFQAVANISVTASGVTYNVKRYYNFTLNSYSYTAVTTLKSSTDGIYTTGNTITEELFIDWQNKTFDSFSVYGNFPTLNITDDITGIQYTFTPSSTTATISSNYITTDSSGTFTPSNPEVDNYGTVTSDDQYLMFEARIDGGVYRFATIIDKNTNVVNT